MRRFRRGFHKSQRRKVAWGSSQWADSAVGNIGGGTVLFETAWLRVPADAVDTTTGFATPTDWTLIRSIPSAAIFGSAAGTTDFNFFMGAGVIVWEGMSDNPPTILDVPNPVFNGSADWVWRWVAPFAGNYAAGSGFFGQSQGSDIYNQSRAQRKLSSRQGLLLVIGIDNTLGLAQVNDLDWTFDYHAAFKLP